MADLKPKELPFLFFLLEKNCNGDVEVRAVRFDKDGKEGHGTWMIFEVIKLIWIFLYCRDLLFGN